MGTKALDGLWMSVILSMAWALPAAAAQQVIVAWNDPSSGQGRVAGMSAEPPWAFETPEITVGLETTLRVAHGLVYAVSRTAGTVAVIDPQAFIVTDTFNIGATSQPLDIAVASEDVAYVTRHGATHLLRLDLVSGATAEVVDLSPFADEEGVKMNTMAIHQGRLFIQMQQWIVGEPTAGVLAVVDLETETLIDVDPGSPGVQGIALEGRAPKMKMQVLDQSLYVSATGVFFDPGGIEIVDLDTLQTQGVAVPESDLTGAEMGAS